MGSYARDGHHGAVTQRSLSRHSPRCQWELLEVEEAYHANVQSNRMSHLKIRFVVDVIRANARSLVVGNVIQVQRSGRDIGPTYRSRGGRNGGSTCRIVHPSPVLQGVIKSHFDASQATRITGKSLNAGTMGDKMVGALTEVARFGRTSHERGNSETQVVIDGIKAADIKRGIQRKGARWVRGTRGARGIPSLSSARALGFKEAARRAGRSQIMNPDGLHTSAEIADQMLRGKEHGDRVVSWEVTQVMQDKTLDGMVKGGV